MPKPRGSRIHPDTLVLVICCALLLDGCLAVRSSNFASQQHGGLGEPGQAVADGAVHYEQPRPRQGWSLWRKVVVASAMVAGVLVLAGSAMQAAHAAEQNATKRFRQQSPGDGRRWSLGDMLQRIPAWLAAAFVLLGSAFVFIVLGTVAGLGPRLSGFWLSVTGTALLAALLMLLGVLERCLKPPPALDPEVLRSAAAVKQAVEDSQWTQRPGAVSLAGVVAVVTVGELSGTSLVNFNVACRVLIVIEFKKQSQDSQRHP
eukprot:TRINITY_DN31720_c0_g1_i1.p1 TRINITY_DN31720_c0_g1~~TRINITY_DN31720_c0_g1_i1.p1  ORF type:complete len:260 (-),score=37.59 TRINITY_DN31720_c0_g1_i1:346-1125(-)